MLWIINYVLRLFVVKGTKYITLHILVKFIKLSKQIQKEKVRKKDSFIQGDVSKFKQVLSFRPNILCHV